jgi:histone H3/H4
MAGSELEAIVSQAVARMAEQGVELEFSQHARRRLASLASGFPWFVHILGQASALSVIRSGRKTVNVEDVEAAVIELNQNRFAQAFSDRYQRAVRDSIQRELVIRAFASWSDVDIPTSEIYRVLRDDLNVINPSVYKGHVTQEEYDAVLMDAPFQGRGLVRFTDEMFKRYIQLRPSLYTGVRERVEAAFANT